MPKSAVQLRVWLIGFDESEEEAVKNLLEEHEFSISTTWEPAQGEVEYQSAGFADTDENVNQIRELESALEKRFQDAEVSFSGLDKSRQTTADRPIKGVYHLRIEK